jgi:peptidylprolyl isomerase
VRLGIINLDSDEDRERGYEIQEAFPRAFKSITGLHYVVDRVGVGDTPYPGSVVRMTYQLRLLDGTPIESVTEPVRARVGQPPMLKGLTEALLGMRVGEVRTIILPPQLAYGLTGKAPSIPPKATLVYVVELLAVEPGERPTPG